MIRRADPASSAAVRYRGNDPALDRPLQSVADRISAGEPFSSSRGKTKFVKGAAIHHWNGSLGGICRMSRIVHPPAHEHRNLRQPLERGEKMLFDLLDGELDHAWEIYIQPHLNGLSPYLDRKSVF